MNATKTQTTNDLDSLLGQIASEFFERLSRGENPKIDEYAERHPQIAQMIRQAFPALEMVNESLGSETRDGEGLAEVHQKQLGDFRIVRELGRGGMGIVYEAEQISMGRRVALKVLPFATMIDEKRLQRFRNEVRAAAALDHPNIVSVYSVGEERGLHFYAMQLIRGQSMADVIEQLRELRHDGPALSGRSISDVVSRSAEGSHLSGSGTVAQTYAVDVDAQSDEETAAAQCLRETEPVAQAAVSTAKTGRGPKYFRSVVELGIQAADALAHAHEQGVIHRDIKPGNLMLDAHAKLHVTDFGLARIESDIGVTMTGDLIGTLRYMSPEQALAKPVVVDHRADIYSLGATLYELLTLEPTFDGRDRQALLRQIAMEEPRQLRQIDRAIAKDLETIVHTAMAKDRDERYDSADALAADLRSFLANRSILAKPPSMAQRLIKVGRRYRGLIATAVVSAIVALAIATGFIFQSYRRETEQRKLAEAQSDRADANLRLALESMNELYVEVVYKRLMGLPEGNRACQAFVEKAIPFYQQFAKQNQANAELWPSVAIAYRVQGEMQQFQGHNDAAEHAYKQSISMLEAINANEPDVADFRYQLAAANGNLAVFYADNGREDLAEPHYLKTEQLLSRLTKNFPKDLRYELGWLNAVDGLGTIAGEDENGLAEAVHYFELAIPALRTMLSQKVEQFSQYNGGDVKAAEAQLENSLAGSLDNLAYVKLAQDNAAEAESLVLEAIRHEESALAKDPERSEVRMFLRNHYGLLGRVHRQSAEHEEAADAYSKAVEHENWLVANFPTAAPLRLSAAETHYNLANALSDVGESEQSEHHYRKCLSLLDNLKEGGFDLPGQLKVRAQCTYNLGSMLAKSDRTSEAREVWQISLACWSELADESPDSEDFPEYRGRVGATLHHLATLLQGAGELQAARELFDEAIEHQEQALEAEPTHANNQQFMLKHLHSLTRVCLDLGDYRAAAAASDALLQHAAGDRKYLQVVTKAYAVCAKLAANDQQLSENERHALEKEYANKAACYAKSVAAQPSDS